MTAATANRSRALGQASAHGSAPTRRARRRRAGHARGGPRRAEDVWEPLIAVADLAGGDWPARARKAAAALTAEDDTDTTLGARLLADLRDVFGGADTMHGETILDRAAQDQRGTVG